MFILKRHCYTLFLLCFFFIFLAAQEVHKNTRDPFKACEKLGPQGPGAATTRLGVVLAGVSPCSLLKIKAASVSRALESMKCGDLLIGNFRGGKWFRYLPAAVISVHLAGLPAENQTVLHFFSWFFQSLNIDFGESSCSST